MMLQLHDGPSMASIQGVPDIPLPQALKVDQRQALIQAVPVAMGYIQKQLEKKKDAFPGLDVNAWEDVPELPGEEDPGTFAGPIVALIAKVGAWVAANLPVLIQGIETVAKQVPLLVFNQRVMARYNANAYNVQQLNNMDRREIEMQLQRISTDLINASQSGQKQEAAVLTRFSQVYQLRLDMLPIISNRTLMIAGGALLAFYLLKKK